MDMFTYYRILGSQNKSDDFYGLWPDSVALIICDFYGLWPDSVALIICDFYGVWPDSVALIICDFMACGLTVSL